MNCLVVYAHPNPRSFNAALAAIAEQTLEQAGHNIAIRDLYGLNYDPVLDEKDYKGIHSNKIPHDIIEEQQLVNWADLLVFIAPVWNYGFPAILKGYFDRIFTVGFAYKYDEKGAHGLLKGKRALVITTSGAMEETAESTGMVDVFDIIVNGLFSFFGFADYQYKNFFGVPTVSDTERGNMLEEFREMLKQY